MQQATGTTASCQPEQTISGCSGGGGVGGEGRTTKLAMLCSIVVEKMN